MMNRAIPEQVEISSEDSSPAANDDVEGCKQPNADYYRMDQPVKKLTSEGMESQSDDNVFLPQVPISQIPKVNQEFESHEEAYTFYNQYARATGFSVRIANCKKNKETNETCWKLYVCSMEGKTNDTYQRKLKDSVPRAGERNRVHTRVGCNARLSVVKKQTGQFWVVSKFVEEHNHGLASQSRVHLLRSHRNVSATKKALMQQFLEANIPTHQQVRLMEIDSGGASAIRCVEREIKNHESDHDAETLIEHFTLEKEKSSNFVFDFETDVDNKLLRCFWADPKSRRSYSYFGDVVMFDTIYNTNWYSMILATFIGVNHHGQTIIFACGLLSDETTESFVWLFSKFLEAMKNQPPPSLIITDQDIAISKAITTVLPFTLHRYCLWHILNKFSKKINVMSYTKQYHKLVSIIKESESPDEFEHRWTEVMESTNLDCNEWLSSMYEIRSRWVPAYFKNVFSAGMSSCQRSESDSSFLKKCVDRKNTLMGFITRFNRALAHQRREELVANHIDLSEPKLASFLMMENQMVHIYTKKIFLLFQKEVEQSNLYICSKRSSSIDAKVFDVERFEPGKTSELQRELTYFIGTDFITCSCGMFEFHGYPCRHMLCYMKKKQVLLLPDKYIKRRWTKNARAGSVYEPMVGLNDNHNSSQSLMARREFLAYMASLLVDDASLTDARSTFLLNEFRQLHIKLKDMDNRANVGRSQSESRSREETQVVCDPNVVRAKGCWKRLNSSKEKDLSESSRQCRSCGDNSQDKRTCPELHIRSNMLDDSYQPQHGYKDTHHDEREDATCSNWLLRRAEVYQEYMNLILVPSLRGSLIPFTSWIGLGRSMKQLYGQPLHYLTNISLKQWDQSRIGAKDEQIPLDTIIHPCKAEASIWLMEEVNRLTTSHHHLAKLWLADPMHHAFIDPIFPKLRA